MSSLRFCEGWGSCVSYVEAHEQFSDVSGGFHERVVVEEQARARATSVESVFVGFGKADEFGESDLWLPCGIVGVLVGGRHVVASC